MVIECKLGDLVEQKDVDAIVNASNASLQLGGGVAGVIRRADPEVQVKCDKIGPIKTGEAVLTTTKILGNVIHAVGPVWNAAQSRLCKKQLRAAYESALQVAKKNGFRRIAFPFLSSGIFGFKAEFGAASIPYDVVKDANFELIRFVDISESPCFREFQLLLARGS